MKRGCITRCSFHRSDNRNNTSNRSGEERCVDSCNGRILWCNDTILIITGSVDAKAFMCNSCEKDCDDVVSRQFWFWLFCGIVLKWCCCSDYCHVWLWWSGTVLMNAWKRHGNDSLAGNAHLNVIIFVKDTLTIHIPTNTLWYNSFTWRHLLLLPFPILANPLLPLRTMFPIHQQCRTCIIHRVVFTLLNRLANLSTNQHTQLLRVLLPLPSNNQITLTRINGS